MSDAIDARLTKHLEEIRKHELELPTGVKGHEVETELKNAAKWTDEQKRLMSTFSNEFDHHFSPDQKLLLYYLFEKLRQFRKSP
jgi:hypothetical protein